MIRGVGARNKVNNENLDSMPKSKILYCWNSIWDPSLLDNCTLKVFATSVGIHYTVLCAVKLSNNAYMRHKANIIFAAFQVVKTVRSCETENIHIKINELTVSNNLVLDFLLL